MPLVRLTAADAFDNLSSPGAAWPRDPEQQRERLSPLAKPLFSPSFRFDRTQSIFTIGSCFARNIEEQLQSEGYETAAAHFAIPEPLQARTGTPSIRNRFTCFSILNELRWALDPDARFPAESIVETRKDKWIDLNAPHDTAPSPRHHVIERRRLIAGYMDRVREADVVVVTLGLAEAWFDTATGYYVNAAPYRPVREREPGRFEFHLLDYDDILGALERIHALLVAHGRPGVRMLITVSPVALGASYTGQDALVANGYSKAVQRAAVEAFVRRHDDVDYFPSFESVTLSDRSRAWRGNQRHASHEIIRLNVLRMLRAYGEDPIDEAAIGAVEEAYACTDHGRAMVAAGDLDAARTAFAQAAAIAPGEALIRFRHADFLLKTADYEAAIVEAHAALACRRPPTDTLYVLARACRGAGQAEAAYEALGEALKADRYRGALLVAIAEVAEETGRPAEAMRHLDTLLATIGPDPVARARTLAARERVAGALSPAP